jgi:FkbM family methyltransferase
MRNSIKNFVKKIISSTVALLGKTKVGGFAFDQVLNSVMQTTQSLTHRQTLLVFAVPNNLNRFRVNSFSTKEPETLEWIDGFPRDSVVWDVGANVGLYSCYAAKARSCKVFAFEPSVFNLELLARNIYLNRLTTSVAIVPLPLSNNLGFSTLNMTSTEWGGALSTFGQEYGWDGHKMNQVFNFQTIGLSADDAVRLMSLPQPNYIKIDVDGIEHLILNGAQQVLNKVNGVLIEVNDDFPEQADQCNKLLLEAGLILKEKRHSEMFDSAEALGGKVWNQIWIRL